MYLRIISLNEDATLSLGRFLGAHLPPSVLGLDGDLGVGKTHFVAGFAEGLGYTGSISSPTFTLVSEYVENGARLPLYHMDACRLPSADSFFEAGLDEYFAMGGICIIEWASLVRDALPPDTLNFRFVRLDEPDNDLTLLDKHDTDSNSIQIELPDDVAVRQIDMTWPDLPLFTTVYRHLVEAISQETMPGLRLA